MTERRTTYIDRPDALDAALAEWRRAPRLAVDIESNSFFVYRERTCLVQVSTTDADWIVDPLAVDLAPMGPLFANPDIEKVFHAGEFDVLSLKRDYGFTFTRLFDTLIAAKALGRKKLGLAGLAQDLLGITLAKEEQRSDWGRRPLTPKQIAYAYADTRHLLEIAALLRQELAAKGPEVEEEVAMDCERLTRKEPRPREVDPEAFERHPSARTLDPVSRQILRQLYEARERRARDTDKPPFRVASEQVLGEIAVRKADTRAALSEVPGVTPPVMRRHGDALLEAVREGIALGPLPRVRRPYTAPDLDEEARHEALRAWRREVATARGVDVDVILGNAAIRAISKANPRALGELEAVEEIDSFRTKKYGEAILRVTENPPPVPVKPRRGQRTETSEANG